MRLTLVTSILHSILVLPESITILCISASQISLFFAPPQTSRGIPRSTQRIMRRFTSPLKDLLSRPIILPGPRKHFKRTSRGLLSRPIILPDSRKLRVGYYCLGAFAGGVVAPVVALHLRTGLPYPQSSWQLAQQVYGRFVEGAPGRLDRFMKVCRRLGLGPPST